MEKQNQDVFPPEELIALFAGCKSVVVNRIIDDAFREYETKAVAAKRSYHRRGRLGASLVLASVLFTVAAAFVDPSTFLGSLSGFSALGFAAVCMGVLGLGIQLHLLLTGLKKRWLVNRFAAERVRSLKFQAYQFAFSASSESDLKARADTFYRSELARLRAELNVGEAVLGMFSPGRSTAKVDAPATPVAPPLSSLMQKAYRELRILYQVRFATAEMRSLQSAQRVGYAAADMLYLLGAALTMAALIGQLASPHDVQLARWIDFLAISAFVTGLSLSTIEKASISETSKDRYGDYARALEERDRELSEDLRPFPETVREIERTVLGELSQFCLAAAQISYRL